MIDSYQNKKILLVVAHPDDEILGVGGTMHRLIIERNCIVRTIILGEGITSRSDSRNIEKWETELKIHRSNIEKAREFIGFHSVGIYDFPDNRFDSVELLDIIKVIEKEKEDFRPEVIFTHHGGDLNIDHQKTFDAVMTACRPMNTEGVKTIITFETMSGTEWRASTDPRHFIPNMFISISETDLQAKLNAIESYEFERRKFPHPRSSEALKIRAQMWGIANGVDYAEAFCIVRNICF
ncbi:PIG-L deacetylase family protein [Mongoliibacter ruber]|uniref:LmbE family N-acetylglucosaminyl deacetylase n=1 Tax=Mongoliibacter ruber TaxID=1750599 RepID=A0A2T0WG80_9BACT|nr:PIG-L family deacetylase [Mongoliibacter ruber]PRY85675.1 LmbE family N-acetylglucosaminyl deacetylase [Mongoliibacter ruber]